MFPNFDLHKLIFYELNAVTSFKNYTKIIKFSLQFNLKINILDIFFYFSLKCCQTLSKKHLETNTATPNDEKALMRFKPNSIHPLKFFNIQTVIPQKRHLLAREDTPVSIYFHNYIYRQFFT